MSILEVKFQPELNDAHSTVGGNLAEGGAAARIGRIQELDVVEGVEEFRAKFERCGFGHVSILGERQIEIIDTRTTQSITGKRSEREHRHVGAVIGIGIEPEVALRRTP